MSNKTVALIEAKPSRNDYTQLFGGAFEFDRFSLTSNRDVKKVLKADVDIDIDLDAYEWVILVGSEPLKYYTKLSSITEYTGHIVDDKFLPVINPAMITFKPEAKKPWEESKGNIIKYISGELQKVQYETSDFVGIEDKDEAMAYLQAAYDHPNPFIALDSESSNLYARNGYMMGFSITYKEDSGAYILTDCIDEEVEQLMQKIFNKKLVIFHNAKFDIVWFEYHFGFEFPHFGDTMLMHYTLDETQGTHGLKQLALKYTKYGDYEKAQNEWIDHYCKKNRIKKRDFTYDLIPFDIIKVYACLTHDSKVHMSDGSWETIGDLVRSKSTKQVRSYNEVTRVVEDKRIIGWVKQAHNSKEWLCPQFYNTPQDPHKIYGPKFTPDHKLFTEEGWVEAQDLEKGSKILSESLSYSEDAYQTLLGSLMGDGYFSCRNNKGAGFIISQAEPRKNYAKFKAELLGDNALKILKEGNKEPLHQYDIKYSDVLTEYLNSLVFREGFQGSKLYLSKRILSTLDRRALAIWIMDDGNLPENGGLRIWSRTVGKEEQINVINWVNSLGLPTPRYFEDSSKNNQFFTWGVEDTHIISNELAAYFHVDCAYKLNTEKTIGSYIWSTKSTKYLYRTVTSVKCWYPRTKRGYATKWCINVEDNHNFYTKTGLVHNCVDTAVTFALYLKFKHYLDKNAKLTGVYKNILIPGCRFLATIQENGVPFDMVRLKFGQQYMETEIRKAEDELSNFPEIAEFERVEGKQFNPNSTLQLRKLLFDYIGLKPTGKLTGTGKASTDAEVLGQLAELHPIPRHILAIRKSSKIKNTYLDKIIPQLDADGRLRTNFNLSSTTSGRLSSSGKMNMQQLPRDNPAVKGCIKAAPGYTIVAMDLSTVEMYIAAVVSGDLELQDVFRSGGNFHSQIAKKVFKLDCPVEDVAELYRGLRQAAKAISFGILYGASAGKIAATVNAEMENVAKEKGIPFNKRDLISTHQAQETINEYFGTFWKLKEWIDETRDFIKTKAYVYSPFGRKRRLPNVKSDNSGVQGHEIRSGLNFIIQSTASDVNLLGAIEMQAYLEILGSKARIFALVHDSILAEVPDEEVDSYKENLLGFIQKDRGVSIPGVPIGCEFEVVAEDYSNGKFTDQFGEEFEEWQKQAA